MPTPLEHKTVQSRIIQYAQEIGWSFISREEAERRWESRDRDKLPEEQARIGSLFIDELAYKFLI